MTDIPKFSAFLTYGEVIEDLKTGLSRHELWRWLARHDLSRKHGQTLLGILWFPISLCIFALGLTFVFSDFLQIPFAEFLLYVSLGLLFWGFFSRVIVEGCRMFVVAGPLMQQVETPFSVHIFRLIYRNLLFLLYEAVGVVVVMLFVEPAMLMRLPMALPGTVLVALAVAPMAIVIGIVCARYRDIIQLIELAMRFMFFLTPVFWIPKSRGGLRDSFLDLNPLNHMLQLTRQPVLGGGAETMSILVVIGCGMLAWIAALFLIARYKYVIPQWF